MKNKLYIATGSVIIIAFTASLVNIYVVPDLLFKLDIYRNTEDIDELLMLEIAENINMEFDIFADLNLTKMIHDIPDNAIMDIAFMISMMELHLSASYELIDFLYEEVELNEVRSPKRATMSYNGTIFYAETFDKSFYQNWIVQTYDDSTYTDAVNASYLSFKNTSLEIDTYSSIEDVGIQNFVINDAISALNSIYNSTDTEPFYVIYQSVTYKENRGLFRDYSTSFERLIFTDLFGEIIFFITNEGYWSQPLTLF